MCFGLIMIVTVRIRRFLCTVVKAPTFAACSATRSGVRSLTDRHAANVLPVIREIQRSGAGSLRDIAAALNARGISTARGGQWHAMTVRNVLARA